MAHWFSPKVCHTFCNKAAAVCYGDANLIFGFAYPVRLLEATICSATQGACMIACNRYFLTMGYALPIVTFTAFLLWWYYNYYYEREDGARGGKDDKKDKRD